MGDGAELPPEGNAPEQRPADQRGIAARLGIGRAHRHIFLCADATKPKCAPAEQTRALWKHLKTQLRERGLEGSVHTGDALPCVHRNKVDCLRICRGGPIAVVYPEGIWYGGLTIEALDRILEEHLIGGRPVESHRIVTAPLQPLDGDADDSSEPA